MLFGVMPSRSWMCRVLRQAGRLGLARAPWFVGKRKPKQQTMQAAACFVPAAAVQVWLCDVAMGWCAVGPAGH